MIKQFVVQEVWDELKEFGDRMDQPQFFLELLHIFLTSARQQSQMLIESARSEDRKKCGHYAHSLKSNCATLGAQALAQALEEIELDCHESGDGRVSKKVEDLFPKVLKFLEAVEEEYLKTLNR